MRQECPYVSGITTATQKILLGPGQVFMETPKAWELWTKEPLRRIKRWSKNVVFFVIEGERDLRSYRRNRQEVSIS